MTMNVNIGGTWRTVASPQVNVGGTWRPVQNIWVNVGGVWRQAYNRYNVNFTVGAEIDAQAGSPTSGIRRRYRTLTAAITGGSGNFTYAWSQTGAQHSGFLGTTSSSALQWSQTYNINDDTGEPLYDTAQISLTVTDNGTGIVRTITKTVTLG